MRMEEREKKKDRKQEEDEVVAVEAVGVVVESHPHLALARDWT